MQFLAIVHNGYPTAFPETRERLIISAKTFAEAESKLHKHFEYMAFYQIHELSIIAGRTI